METDKYKYIYFLGIGGIGMSALARYYKACGKQVAGYDKTPTQLTDALAAENIKVHFEEDIQQMLRLTGDKSETLVVITPAVPADHKELVFVRENGYDVMKRSQVLGLISKMARTIAVAGTHGKTTTSSIIAHIFHNAGRHVSAFLGGIAKNINSNLLLDKDLLNRGNANQWIVAEADEYDRSFLQLHPQFAVITSLDADHLDIYGTPEEMVRNYNEFANQITGTCIAKKGLKIAAPHLTYSIKEKADFTAENIRIENHSYLFDAVFDGGVMKSLMLGLPGLHNVENSLAAIAVCHIAGLSEDEIRSGLLTYQGVRRRFDYKVRSSKVIYLDDYAHHPEELRACISSVREMYKGKRITGIFQPHLFTRTRDFVDGFAKSLSLLDELLLMDIYPAREKPIEGITSQIILDRVTIADKQILNPLQIQEKIKNQTPEVLMTLGAGDIDKLIEPLKAILEAC